MSVIGSINPLNIHVGRGDIYIGTTAPVTPPVPLTGGIPSDGRLIGATLAPCNFIWRPVTFDIRTQQDTGIVGYVIIEDEARLEFEVGEITFENLRDAMIGSTPQTTYVTLGSNIIPSTTSVLIVAPKRTGASAFIEVMLYQAIFAEDRTFPFARESWMNVRVVARAQAVLSRAQGDRQAFFHPNVVSS